MTAISGDFIGLDSSTLATLKTAYTNAIAALATAQSYSIGGRSVTRAQLPELRATLKEVLFAQKVAAGTAVRTTLARSRRASY